MIMKHLTQKGEEWALYVACAAHTMNTFVFIANEGFSPYKILLLEKYNT